MNELVDETCAVLVTPVRTDKQNFGVRYAIDVSGFERSIQRVLTMPIDQRMSLGALARRRYIRDRHQFQSQLIGQVIRLAQT
jgi:hypothetical protein